MNLDQNQEGWKTKKNRETESNTSSFKLLLKVKVFAGEQNNRQDNSPVSGTKLIQKTFPNFIQYISKPSQYINLIPIPIPIPILK
jgi:hypothetical protein